MDIRQYLSVPLRRWKEILLLVILCVVLSLYFASKKGDSFPVTMFYTISLDDKQQTEEFKYSNFYATQSGLEFTRTVSGWFDDPSFESQAFNYAKLNKDEEIDSISKLLGFFKMKRVERQNIQVTFKTNKDEKSHVLADALTKTIKERLSEYNKISNSDYKVALTSKWVERKEVSYPLVGILAFLLSFILSFFLCYLYEYFMNYISTQFEAEEVLKKEALEVSSLKSWPSVYLKKMAQRMSFEQVIGIGFSPLNIDKVAQKAYQFPLELEKIEPKKKSLLVVKLGCSKLSDLAKASRLFELSAIELVIIK